MSVFEKMKNMGVKKVKTVIVGVSGYTGVELLRLLITHPHAEISALVANSNAGKTVGKIYPHISHVDLPEICKIEDVNFAKIDVAFCCLPHGTGHEIISKIPKNVKIIDLSADFRIDNIEVYEKWYGKHLAPDLQKYAVYGLSEINRGKIKNSRIIACPGCYPTSILLPLLPLIEKNMVDAQNIIADSKSGVSGAGRSLKVDNLFCEANEGVKAYGVGCHRHIAEIEQELSKVAILHNGSGDSKSSSKDGGSSGDSGSNLKISFTPHLAPMNRGILSTIYVNAKGNVNAKDIKYYLKKYYDNEQFVCIVEDDKYHLSSRETSGTNLCKISVHEGRIDGQIILVSAIDNLIKGASGQAVQNMNIIYGWDENSGLK